ncbi:MAG: hypothetical protein AB7I38_13350 [Dehalococcoidia bacterium]
MTERQSEAQRKRWANTSREARRAHTAKAREVQQLKLREAAATALGIEVTGLTDEAARFAARRYYAHIGSRRSAS